MNYVAVFATWKNGEWVKPKYQTMSADGPEDLEKRFYQLYDYNTNWLGLAYWWENYQRKEHRFQRGKRRAAHPVPASARQ